MFKSLLSTLILLVQAAQSLPAETCDQQSKCLRLQAELASPDINDDIQYEVCLIWNNESAECVKDVSDTISHACSVLDDGDDIQYKKKEEWESDQDDGEPEEKMCQIVKCNSDPENIQHTVTFAVKDGGECPFIGDEADIPLIGDDLQSETTGASCNGGGRCQEKGNSKACEWTIDAPLCPEPTTTPEVTEPECGESGEGGALDSCDSQSDCIDFFVNDDGELCMFWDPTDPCQKEGELNDGGVCEYKISHAGTCANPNLRDPWYSFPGDLKNSDNIICSGTAECGATYEFVVIVKDGNGCDDNPEGEAYVFDNNFQGSCVATSNTDAECTITGEQTPCKWTITYSCAGANVVASDKSYLSHNGFQTVDENGNVNGVFVVIVAAAIIGVVSLGAVGIFGYNKYKTKNEEMIVATAEPIDIIVKEEVIEDGKPDETTIVYAGSPSDD